MSNVYEQAAMLRALADALDHRRAAHLYPDISPPDGVLRVEGYHCNPVLLAAVEAEIRLSWDELRARALARLDASVEHLSAQVRRLVADAPSPTDGGTL